MLEWRGMDRDARRHSASAALAFLLIIPTTLSAAAESRKDAVTSRNQGYEAQQRGEWKSAALLYRKAAVLDRTYAVPHNDLGVLLEEEGRLKDAERAYREAISLNPGYAGAYGNLALLYERMGEPEKSVYCWYKRYQLGTAEDLGTQRAKDRLSAAGLLDEQARPVAALADAASIDAVAARVSGDLKPEPSPVLPPAPEPQAQGPGDAEAKSPALAAVPEEASTALRETRQERPDASASGRKREADAAAEKKKQARVARAAQPKPVKTKPAEPKKRTRPPVAMLPGSLSINEGRAETPIPTVRVMIPPLSQPGWDMAQVARMQLANDSQRFSAPEPFATLKTWTLSPGDGPKRVRARLLDRDGLPLAELDGAILLDASVLAITVPPDPKEAQRRQIMEEALQSNTQTLKEFRTVTEGSGD